MINTNTTPHRFPTMRWNWPLLLLIPMFAAACVMQYSYTSGRPRPLDLVVVGSPTLNRGEDGQAHSVIVRVYELTSAANFQRSTPTALREDDDRALGAEYIAKQVLILQPGAEQRLRLELNAETRFVGIAADFTQPDPNRWRQVHDASSRRKQLRVVLGEDHLAIEPR